ncbi:hypothetical protein RclHR1_09460003 [Rhizophagus clarus]|uniref:Uncharacterized protein n=1 Tax=Rhizophagus clarus TaxID=94130 RepID=A0A2Z6SHQ1_9GLOM|nr:hypothetical protein RclHR1_09460003 [Rhizophagus clarus]
MEECLKRIGSRRYRTPYRRYNLRNIFFYQVLSSDHFLEHGSMMGFIWWCFKFEGIRTRQLKTYGKKILYFLERSDDVVPPHTSCPFKSLPSDLSDPYTILRIQLQSLDGCWSNSFILNMARTTF